jgi:16S rRNA C1402 N4-methylase RsmH
MKEGTKDLAQLILDISKACHRDEDFAKIVYQLCRVIVQEEDEREQKHDP